MSDKSSNSIAETKIIILYLTDKVPGISYHMLMDGCMKSLYVEFFDFAQAYEELIAGNLMTRSSSELGKTDTLGTTDVLSLTEGGKAVLKDLLGTINSKLAGTLDTIAAELEAKCEDNNSINVVKTPSDNGVNVEITVTLTAKDNEEADAIIRNWRSNHIKLTNELRDQLLPNS